MRWPSTERSSQSSRCARASALPSRRAPRASSFISLTARASSRADAGCFFDAVLGDAGFGGSLVGGRPVAALVDALVDAVVDAVVDPVVDAPEAALVTAPATVAFGTDIVRDAVCGTACPAQSPSCDAAPPRPPTGSLPFIPCSFRKHCASRPSGFDAIEARYRCREPTPESSALCFRTSSVRRGEPTRDGPLPPSRCWRKKADGARRRPVWIGCGMARALSASSCGAPC